jgi:hypothetical protein
MPRTATDYSKTIIYKIVCKNLEVKDCYVGQTTAFKSRKHVHFSHCKNPKKNKLKLYQVIIANGGWENWSMIEIEKYPCKDATRRERYWCEVLNANLNIQSAIFLTHDNIDTSHIVGINPKDTNRLKGNFRKRKTLEGLNILRLENQRLKDLLTQNNIPF